MIPTVVVGAGGHGQDLAALIEAVPDRTFAGFLDDDPPEHVDALGPATLDHLPDRAEYVVGINDPHTRWLVSTVRGFPVDRAAVLVHPAAVVGPRCHLGKGAVVAAGAVLDTQVTLGWHTHVHTGATITRTWVLPYSTVCPGAHIGGDCVIGHRTLIGAGATVRNLVGVGDDVTVGAGATVLRHLPAHGVYVGTPAHPIGAAA